MVEIKGVSEREWKGIDKQVASLLREPIIFQRLPGTLQLGKGKNKGEYYQATDVFYVNEGNRFSYEDKNTGARKVRDAIITYLTLPVHVDEKDIDATSTEGITPILSQIEIEVRAKMMEKIQKVILHGSTASGGRGMCTFQQDEETTYAFAAAGTWTTTRAFFTDLESARNLLRKAHIMPPYKLWMTPGIAPTLKANLTTTVSDWKYLLQDYFHYGVVAGEAGKEPLIPVIDEIMETDAIVNAALTTSNQAFILWKDDVNACYVGESYPIHRANIPEKPFEGDVDYALRWAGCFIPKNPKGVVYCHTGASDVAY